MPTYTSTSTLGSNVVLAGSSGSFGSVINTIQAPIPITGYTDYGLINGFSLAVPGGETIVGIKATINCYALTAAPDIAIDHSAKLYTGSAVGSDHANLTAWANSVAPRVYGGSADTWGLSLTPAQVNSGTFGVVVSAALSGIIAGTAIIQKLTATMEITTILGGAPPKLPPPTSGIGSTSSISPVTRHIPNGTVREF